MKEQPYDLKTILHIMASGELFSCKVVKYDRKRKTGGQILEIVSAKLVSAEKKEKQQAATPATRAATPMEQLQQKRSKKPHHFRWFTRNIRLYTAGLPTSQILKIHPPLIIEFNGNQVV